MKKKAPGEWLLPKYPFSSFIKNLIENENSNELTLKSQTIDSSQ